MIYLKFNTIKWKKISCLVAYSEKLISGVFIVKRILSRHYIFFDERRQNAYTIFFFRLGVDTHV